MARSLFVVLFPVTLVVYLAWELPRSHLAVWAATRRLRSGPPRYVALGLRD